MTRPAAPVLMIVVSTVLGPRARLRVVVAAAAALMLDACVANLHLIYPDHPGAGIVTWSEVVDADGLRIHLDWARPSGAGATYPTVLVHPHGGRTAPDMHGVVWDLAARGYVAVAADYERRVDGTYERNLFAWRSPRDVTAALDAVVRSPYVDATRVAVLGFSQGGVFSLLIAAHAPRRVCAVVAYYPVTDFPRWLGAPRSGIGERIAFAVVRWFFRRQSGATSDAQFQEILTAASPYYVAEDIEAPVLLVHGDRDTTAPLEESRRMAERLTALGKSAELVVVPGGVHIFNFRQKALATEAWRVTTDWLDRRLRPSATDGQRARHGIREPARHG